MLLLKRRAGESLILDGKIKITVVASSAEGVKLAINKDQVQHLKEILKKKEVEEAYGSDK